MKEIIVKKQLTKHKANAKAYFSITAEIYEQSRNGRKVLVGGGCCHEEILKKFPQYKPLVDLHLSDEDGVPSGAAVNALHAYMCYRRIYRNWDSSQLHESNGCPASVIKNRLRLSDQETSDLIKCLDEAIQLPVYEEVSERLFLNLKCVYDLEQAVKAMQKAGLDTSDAEMQLSKLNSKIASDTAKKRQLEAASKEVIEKHCQQLMPRWKAEAEAAIKEFDLKVVHS